MTKKTLLGIVATLAWAVLIALLVVSRRAELSTMTLEKWGTFLGGVTGPVAFLWLILGYLQQGEELRLNTRALQLQQEELRHQVAETAKLVLHAETQAQATMDAVLLERQREDNARKEKKKAAQPFFAFRGSNDSATASTMKFKNTGGRTRVQSFSSPQTTNVVITPSSVIEPGDEGTFYYEGLTTFPAEMVLEYLDDFGETHTVIIDIPRHGSFKQRELDTSQPAG